LQAKILDNHGVGRGKAPFRIAVRRLRGRIRGTGGRERIHAGALHLRALLLAVLSPLLRLRLRSSGGPFEIPHQTAAHGEIREQTCQDQRGASPAILRQQPLRDRREDEGTYSAAADRQTSREGSLLVEVIRHDYNRRDEAQGQAETRHDAKREDQHFHRVRERTHDEAGRRQQAARYGHFPASVSVREKACHGTRQQRHRHEETADPRRFGFPFAKVIQEFNEYDAEREGDAVSDQIHHEGGRHDDPAPTTIGRSCLAQLLQTGIVVRAAAAAAGRGRGDRRARMWPLFGCVPLLLLRIFVELHVKLLFILLGGLSVHKLLGALLGRQIILRRQHPGGRTKHRVPLVEHALEFLRARRRILFVQAVGPLWRILQILRSFPQFLTRCSAYLRARISRSFALHESFFLLLFGIFRRFRATLAEIDGVRVWSTSQTGIHHHRFVIVSIARDTRAVAVRFSVRLSHDRVVIHSFTRSSQLVYVIGIGPLGHFKGTADMNTVHFRTSQAPFP